MRSFSFFSCLLLVTACGVNPPVPQDSGVNAVTGYPDIQNPDEKHLWYLYANPPQGDAPFDPQTGALRTGVAVTDLSTTPFSVQKGVTGNVVPNSPFPEGPVLFNVYGSHALKWTGKHTFDDLWLGPSSYAQVDGELVLGGLNIGFAFPAPVGNLKPVAQGASLFVPGTVITGNVAVSAGFLKVTGSLQITKDLTQTSSFQGILVDNPYQDRWRFWTVGFAVSGSVFASTLAVRPDSTVDLHSTQLRTDLKSQEGVIKFSSHNTLTGQWIGAKTWMLFEESTGPADEALGIASLRVNGTALVNGSLSVKASWSPGDEEKLRTKYHLLFGKKSSYVLVQATKLLGRALLKSQAQAQQELGSSSQDINYVEKFLAEDGKKFALQHDYTQGTITLHLVPQTTALDKDSCLPDVGTFNPSEYKTVLASVSP